MSVSRCESLQNADRPREQQFLNDVLAGLHRKKKSLPCKYLYDDEGSRLFDLICELPEYYPTRTELAIMQQHCREVADIAGERVLVIELGSGSGQKTSILLDSLRDPAGYVPVDISLKPLMQTTRALAEARPRLPVFPLWADFSHELELPANVPGHERRLIYFPGSTIGNLDQIEAEHFLHRIARMARPRALMLVGVDLQKDPQVLHAAYNDSQGVTARFNLNLLQRINRELRADFRARNFLHDAPYNRTLNRVEMHLVSQCDHQVSLGGGAIVRFRAGETIHTESSYKYTLPQFAALAARAGWNVEQVWTDERRYFSVQLLQAC